MAQKKLGLGFYYILTALWGICFAQMLLTGRNPFLVLLCGICFFVNLAITSMKVQKTNQKRTSNDRSV